MYLPFILFFMNFLFMGGGNWLFILRDILSIALGFTMAT